MNEWERRESEAHREFCRSRLVDDSEAEKDVDKLTTQERSVVEQLREFGTFSEEVIAIIDRLAPPPEPSEGDPVTALLREWFGEGTSDSYIAELKRQLEAALNQEKDNA